MSVSKRTPSGKSSNTDDDWCDGEPVLLSEFSDGDDPEGEPVLVAKPQSLDTWQQGASHCHACDTPFEAGWVWSGVHHCRWCGFAFCEPCSDHFLPLPEGEFLPTQVRGVGHSLISYVTALLPTNPEGAERLCDLCFQLQPWLVACSEVDDRSSSLEMPPWFERACAYLEQHGMETEGLFRLSSDFEQLREFRDAICQKGVTGDLDFDQADVHVVADLLKRLFRSLPVPLFTFSLHSQFVNATQDHRQEEQRVRVLASLIKQLPPSHRLTLARLAALLDNVALSPATRMSYFSLATVWAPNLFRRPRESEEPEPAQQALHQEALELRQLIVSLELILSHRLAITE